MTRDELDTMWQKALIASVRDGEKHTRYHFAALVAEAEREACAKVCDHIYDAYDTENVDAHTCSDAIRARGEV